MPIASPLPANDENVKMRIRLCVSVCAGVSALRVCVYAGCQSRVA